MTSSCSGGCATLEMLRQVGANPPVEGRTVTGQDANKDKECAFTGDLIYSNQNSHIVELGYVPLIGEAAGQSLSCSIFSCY